MREEVITSRQNPLCTHFRKLASSRAFREEAGEYLCDSPKLLAEAARWGAPLCTVAYTRRELLPQGLPGDVRLIQVNERVMGAISPAKTPQGVVFSCKMPPPSDVERLAPGRYLLLEGVQDPGNVGAVLRTANAFGWEVFLLEGCADLYSPKTVRAAMGVHFRSELVCTCLERAAALVKDSGLPLYAAALGEKTVDIRQAELSQCAVIIGSEGRGVSDRAMELCTAAVKIPMEPCCESLNASVAAGIILWEGWRGSLPSPAPDLRLQAGDPTVF